MTITFGPGNDGFNGGSGNDSVDGGGGNDSLNGGNGDDSLDGNVGDDQISGDNGNDSLFGGQNSDTIFGGPGDDQIDGFSGADSLEGGDGNDSITSDTNNDFLRGGNGNDTLTSTQGGDTILGESGDDLLNGGIDADTLAGGDGSDNLVGGDGNDIAAGEDGDDFINGGNGNDSIDGGDGNDLIGGESVDTEAGDDLIVGGNGNDTLFGGSGGRDTLFGEAGNDSIFGDIGAGNDSLDGGEGSDTLNGFAGNDSLNGGPGNDSLIGDAGRETYIFPLSGGGIDTIDHAELGEMIFVLGAAFGGSVTPGNGGSVGLNQAQVATEPGPMSTSVSTLFIGTDTLPGADIVIKFAHDFFVGTSFLLDGSSIEFVQAPSLSIADAAIAEGNAGPTNLVFTLSLNAATFADVTAIATTANGTAIAGEDFVQTSQLVTIPAGQTSATFTVPLTGDGAVEQGETFTVTLTNLINAFPGDAVAIGTILDDDGSRLVTIASTLVGEGDSSTSNAQFTINLSSAAQQDVIVTASTSDGTALAGSDYTATTGQVTIPAGQTSAVFSVPIIGDAVQEADESFTVTLSNPINASLGLPSFGVGTILNDDGPAGPPVLSLSNASISEGNAGIVNLVFTLSLSAPSDQAVTLNAATSDGTALAGGDYAAINQIVAIPAGQTSATVSVPILGDTAVEGNETLTLTLSNLAGATFAGGGATLAATGTITNDDASLLSIAPSSIFEGQSGTNSFNFLLSLTAALASPTIVSFRTLAGSAQSPSDFTSVASDSVTIPAGQTSGALAVIVKGDTLLECDESFTVEITSVSGGAVLDPTASRASGLIVNDDPGTAPTVDGLTLTGGNGADGLFGATANDSIAGNDGNDTLVGLNGGDVIEGGNGADFLLGDIDGDSLAGGEGNDILVGGQGEDTMRGSNGDDALFGSSGNDTAIGGVGRDVMLGEDGNDLLCGEDGDDYLIGGVGVDSLDAGNGNDRVAIDGGDAYAIGGAGLDVLAIGGTGPTSINLGTAQNQNAGAGPVLQGFEAVDASPATAAVSLTGAAFDGGGNVLLGSAFNDTLTGGAGADIVFGNGGADVLNGGNGNDSLFGGFGNDTMTGGNGKDSFFYSANPGSAVVIADFTPTIDTVVLPASLGLTQLQARLLLVQDGANTVLPLGTGLSITFTGVQTSAFTALDFAIV